jgi:hypothetical protein
MSLLERLFKKRKERRGARLMYAEDAESICCEEPLDESYGILEESDGIENSEVSEITKNERPKRRTDFLNELFF